jgi:hypothetical protein
MGNLFSSATSRHDDVCGQWFDHADANKDGFVDCIEWAAAMRPFLAEAGTEGNRPGMHQVRTAFLQRSGATLQHNDSDKMNREQFVKAMKTFRFCNAAAMAYDGNEMECGMEAVSSSFRKDVRIFVALARTQKLTNMLQAAKPPPDPDRRRVKTKEELWREWSKMNAKRALRGISKVLVALGRKRGGSEEDPAAANEAKKKVRPKNASLGLFGRSVKNLKTLARVVSS